MRIDLYGLMAILQYPLMGTEPLFSMEPYNTSQSATPAAIDFAKGCYWGYNEVYSGNNLHTPITPAELYGQRFGRSLGIAQGISEMCMGTYVTAAGIAGQIGSGIGTIGTGGAASMVTVPVFAASLATTATGGVISAHGYSMFKNAQNLLELKSGTDIKLTNSKKIFDNSKQIIRNNPLNLSEQLALKEAQNGAGKQIMQGKIKDSNFPANEWIKMQHVHTTPDKTKIVIHYWKNIKTGIVKGFKFKN